MSEGKDLNEYAIEEIWGLSESTLEQFDEEELMEKLKEKQEKMNTL